MAPPAGTRPALRLIRGGKPRALRSDAARRAAVRARLRLLPGGAIDAVDPAGVMEATGWTER